MSVSHLGSPSPYLGIVPARQLAATALGIFLSLIHIYGANRLGANSLVSCIYGGMLAGPASVKYARNLEKGCDATDESVFERERVRQREFNDSLLHQQGTENPITIWKEMGETMTENVTVIRYNAKMKETLNTLAALRERYKKINLADRTQWSNQTLQLSLIHI